MLLRNQFQLARGSYGVPTRNYIFLFFTLVALLSFKIPSIDYSTRISLKFEYHQYQVIDLPKEFYTDGPAMSDILSGTPRSNAEPGGRSRTPATKNRSCPFCYAPFTSSSLGRHLDLYIKERNPKPPDDVHDVEEIRRLRGGVTRRQPRTSSAKREDSTHSSSKPTPTRDQRSPSVPARFAGPGLVNGASTKSPFNRSQWEAAAAANDLPPRLNSGEPLSQLAKRRNTTRGASLKEDFGRKQDAQEERDRGRAAELALKELLENVKAAT